MIWDAFNLMQGQPVDGCLIEFGVWTGNGLEAIEKLSARCSVAELRFMVLILSRECLRPRLNLQTITLSYGERVGIQTQVLRRFRNAFPPRI